MVVCPLEEIHPLGLEIAPLESQRAPTTRVEGHSVSQLVILETLEDRPHSTLGHPLPATVEV